MQNKNIPMFSIVMATYNGEKFIKDSIISVLNQTYDNFEFIIVNDNSSDNTKGIILEFLKKDKRIKYIENKKNLGASEARNVGIKNSQGKYIAIIDDDDLWEKDKLEKQLKFINNYKNFFDEVGVLGTNGYKVDEKGEIIGDISNKISNEEIKNNILVYNQFIHSSVIYNKKALEEIYKERGYYFDPKYKIIQDHELLLKIGIKYKLFNLNEKLVCYRINSNGISFRNNTLAYKEKLKITFKYRKFYKGFYRGILATLYPLFLGLLNK